jgi:hypothetical protein
MVDHYHIPLEDFSLEEYQKILESASVLPGRKILKEDISQRFKIFQSEGIKNLKELLEKVKTKKRMKEFSKETGLSEEYLVILRRDIRSYLSKTVYLKDFPGVDSGYIKNLVDISIKNSKNLFERTKTMKERDNLSEEADVPSEYLLELVKLSDLVRVNGVGTLFARMIYETGVDTTEKLANASPGSLFSKLEALNKDKGYTKAKFTVEDIRYCINFAKRLPKAVEY